MSEPGAETSHATSEQASDPAVDQASPPVQASPPDTARLTDPTPSTDPTPPTWFERAGGMPFFERLVDEFYRGVEQDPILLRLYPDPDDLAPARRRLTLFLAQYWGGPTTYNDERGHPKLRMRHMPFTVGPVERDRWLLHMTRAVDAVADDAEWREVLIGYFVPAAEHMRNDTGLPISSRRPGT